MTRHRTRAADAKPGLLRTSTLRSGRKPHQILRVPCGIESTNRKLPMTDKPLSDKQDNLPAEELRIEQRVMQAMRKTLGSVVRDTTPEHSGMRHPLSDSTIDDIKHCFALIAAREREIAEQLGATHFAKPLYPDSPRTAQTVDLKSMQKPRPPEQ